MKQIHAVILAGGRGSRLGVLTERTPKPLVPVLGTPVMSHILSLLSSHGIVSAKATLGYRAEEIKEAFATGNTRGVSLSFFEEEKPLGTAGALREIESFLTDPFLVISGDAMTDFDLSAAIAFHEKSGAVATVVTAKSDRPCDFGLVSAKEDGEVTGYVEKPSWRYVTSDRVNAGIYVLSRSVLPLISKGTVFDFSRDLFPKLIGKGLYAFRGEGYWCDIGTVERYYLCNREAAEGKIGGVRGALPFLGERADVDVGAEIDKRAIIGSGSLISFGSRIGEAILQNGVTVGARAKIGCAILCRGVRVGADAVIGDGCVIGESVVIAPGQTVRAKTHISADKGFMPDAPASAASAFSQTDGLPYCETGLAGSLGHTLTAAHCTSLGSALAVSSERKEGIFFSDGSKEARLGSRLAMCGAELAGCVVTDGGVGFLQLARFALRTGRFDFALFARWERGVLFLECLDKNGAFLDGRTVFRLGSEKKETFESVSLGTRFYDDYTGSYTATLFATAEKPGALSLVVPDTPTMRVLARVATRLGAEASYGTPDSLPEGAYYIRIDGNDTFEILTRRGAEWESYDRWHALAALAFDRDPNGEKDVPILLPSDAPRTLFSLCREAGIPVILAEKSASEPGGTLSGRGYAMADELCLALSFLALKTREGAGGTKPGVLSFATVSKTVNVRSGTASLLAGIGPAGGEPQTGGVLLKTEHGEVSLTAQDAESLLLRAEGRTEEEALSALKDAERVIEEVGAQGVMNGEREK